MIFVTSGTNTLASSRVLSNTNTHEPIVSNMRYLNEQAWTSGGNGLTRHIVSRELDFSPQFRNNRFSYSNQFRGRIICAYARTRLRLRQRLDARSLFPYMHPLRIFCWLFFTPTFFFILSRISAIAVHDRILRFFFFAIKTDGMGRRTIDDKATTQRQHFFFPRNDVCMCWQYVDLNRACKFQCRLFGIDCRLSLDILYDA